jgi:hypothetical protein
MCQGIISFWVWVLFHCFQKKKSCAYFTTLLLSLRINYCFRVFSLEVTCLWCFKSIISHSKYVLINEWVKLFFIKQYLPFLYSTILLRFKTAFLTEGFHKAKLFHLNRSQIRFSFYFLFQPNGFPKNGSAPTIWFSPRPDLLLIVVHFNDSPLQDLLDDFVKDENKKAINIYCIFVRRVLTTKKTDKRNDFGKSKNKERNADLQI